jgi:hypothetical protein
MGASLTRWIYVQRLDARPTWLRPNPGDPGGATTTEREEATTHQHVSQQRSRTDTRKKLRCLTSAKSP